MACLQTGEVGSMALGSQGKSKKHAAAGGGRREEGTSDTSYGPLDWCVGCCQLNSQHLQCWRIWSVCKKCGKEKSWEA